MGNTLCCANGRRATAAHILTLDRKLAKDLKKKLHRSPDLSRDFAALASQYSACPSKRDGGNLGTFYPDQMVAEFDEIVFNEEVGVVHGPIATEFGYHLILIEERWDR